MIRQFNADDLDDVMDLWLKTNIQTHNYIPSSYWFEKFDLVKAMIPEADVLVFEKNGVINGFVGTSGGYIAGLFVDKEARSKGVGKQLIDQLKKQNHRLELHVFEKNDGAIKFYKREGFKTVNQQIDDCTKEIELCMEWENNCSGFWKEG